MVLSIVAYWTWITILAPALRVVTTALAVGAVIAIAGALLALLVIITPEKYALWAILGSILVFGLTSVLVTKRLRGPALRASKDQIIRETAPQRSNTLTPVYEPPTADGQADVAVKLRWFERLGLTSAARARRSAAKTTGENASAWLELTREAAFAQNRISVARRSCERFLDVAATRPFDTEALAHLVVLNKRVPEMIRKRLALSVDATPGHRFRLLDDLVDQLERIAAEGERRLAPHDVLSFDELETERAYLDSYLSQGSSPFPRSSAT